jgi:hypothetical protein
VPLAFGFADFSVKRRGLLLEFFAGSGLALILEFDDVGAGVGRAEEPAGEEIAAGHPYELRGCHPPRRITL